MLVVPLMTSRGQNAREHHFQRHRRVKREREATAWALLGHQRPTIPCTVFLTRVAPSNGLDGDNLQGSLKAVRDQVAQWLGLDDRDTRVRWAYLQRRGPWSVQIDFTTESTSHENP